MSTVASLSVKLLGDTKGLEKSFESSIKSAATWGAGIAAAAAVAAAGLVKGAMDGAAEINKFSQVTGTTKKNYQQWDKVLKDTGYSMEAAGGDFAALGEKAMDASNGVGEGAELFGKLGVEVTGAGGKLKTQGQLFDETIKSLQGMEDVTERNAIASALLGTTGEELAPVLNKTNEELEKMKGGAAIVSEEDLASAAKFKKSWEEVKNTLSTFATTIGIQLMPAFQGLLDWIQENMPQIKSTVKTAFEAVGTAITNVSNFVAENVTPIFSSFFDLIMDNKDKIEVVLSGALDILKGAFEGVKEAVKFVIDNMNILLPVITGITAAVLAQMAINGLVTAYKAWKAVTVTQTTAQWLLNVALNANPLGLVAIAIGAIIAIGVLLYKNWDTITEKLGQFWSYIKEVFGNMKSWIVGKWDDIIEYFGGLKSKLTTKASGMWDGIKESFRGAINWIIEKWNGLQLKLGGQQISLPFGKSFSIPSITLDTPNIPSLDVGTNMVKNDGLAQLHKGETVVPADVAGGGFSGGNDIHIENLIVREEADIQKIAKQLNDYIKQGARKQGVVY